MDRKSTLAIKVYSKYGVIMFYLYILLAVLKKYLSNKKEDDHGWHFDFSHGLAPNKLKVREIISEFHNLSKIDFEDDEIKEDIYPLS